MDVLNSSSLNTQKTELWRLKPGDTFKSLNGTVYILWYFLPNGDAAVLRKELLPEPMCFGSNNNFRNSTIDKYLNSIYLAELENEFGEYNIQRHEVNLLSLNGLDDYGIVFRKVSIPTIDQYRTHRKTIGENIDRWWWLSTPDDSTPSGYSDRCVRCVKDYGRIGYFGYVYGGGVRPFCVLKSSILVQKEICDER